MGMNPKRQPNERHLQALDEKGKGEDQGFQVDETEKTIKESAHWLYWMVGLSLLNSIFAFTGVNWAFAIGLSTTWALDWYTQDMGAVGHALAYSVQFAILAIFGGLGFFASKKHIWAFVVGMGLYFLDGLVDIAFWIMTGHIDVLAVGFHGLVLFMLGKGLVLCLKTRTD